jgi:hypothetical protein
MEYRYALMPLLYSFNDISKLVKEHGFRYHSERAKEKIDCNNSPNLDFAPDNVMYVVTEGSIIVRSLTKSSYDAGSLQRLAATIGLNPFRTAWELLPLSFVADWAFNIGEAITALTGVDWSSQRAGCTSVREHTTETVFHKERWHGMRQIGGGPYPCGTLPLVQRPYDLSFENIIRVRTTNSYVRSLWNKPVPDVVFNPSITWKRFIDGLVLGYQPTKKILRSLR